MACDKALYKEITLSPLKATGYIFFGIQCLRTFIIEFLDTGIRFLMFW